jgi:hypothetical protein
MTSNDLIGDCRLQIEDSRIGDWRLEIDGFAIGNWAWVAETASFGVPLRRTRLKLA